MKNNLISVIVPVYNVEDYIEECVNSLIEQDYNNYEILLIDDGSTDTSGKKCEELMHLSKKIKVYHKENGGLSDARNYGLKVAKGKYVTFVDSDDYVTKDFLSSMYNNLINNNVKISSCGFKYLYSNGNTKTVNYENINTKYNETEAQKYLNIIGYFNVSVCNKLFVRELFDDIQFPVKKKSEDWFVMYKLVEKAKGLYYCSDAKYIYRQRKGSITKASSANTDSIEAAKEVYKYFEKNNVVAPYAAQSLIFAIIGVYNFELCKGSSKKILKSYRKNALAYKNCYTYDKLPKKRKVQLYLFTNCITMYNLMFKIFNNIRKRR